MKKRYFLKSVLTAVLLLFCVTFTGIKTEAAETEFALTPDKASARVLGINDEGWFAKTDGIGYASFIAPSKGGYIEVEYKNISINDWAYARIYASGSGEKLAEADCRANGSVIFRFRSEPGKRNASQMEPGEKYYIEVGKTGYTGNVKINIRFREDANPDGKDQAEQIQINQTYTRTIDGYVGSDNDDDYFKFTANTSGVHHFTINNACGDWLNYCIRKWNSDEYVKTVNGYDMHNDTYSGNTEEFDIMLEAGQTYYLDVWHDYVGNYTFSFNDQRVQQIIMPAATLTLCDGEEYTLSPTVLPAGAYNKTLKYSSNNTGVASVNSSSGKIYAEKPGKAVITATATDGSNTSATCVVYVTPYKPSTPYCEKSTNSSIKLGWSSTYGATGYTVYYKTSSGKSWKTYKSTTSTSYTVKKLKAGTKYQFRIKAYVDADGKKYSVYSDIAKVATAPKQTTITKISKLSKKKYYYGTYYRAKVNWKKVSGATGYKVYYKAPGSSYKTFYKEVKKNSATVQIYRSRYTSGSKKYTFYVVPTIKYDNKTYDGAYSKGKKYTLK